jgi:hypothetical protein
VALACAPVGTAGAADLTESFDAWPPSGWATQNNSSPVGGQAQGWFVGTATTASPDPGPFNAFNGAANAYAAANFASTAGSNGAISSWLITPLQSGVTQGDTVSFYTRKPTIGPGQTDFPDRLEVRVSTGGACSPGSTASGVGDFTTLLVSVNPELTTGIYPQTWTMFTATLPPMPPTTGCVGFRYFVTGGGPTGTNSDYIGLDQVELRDQPDNVTPDTSISGGPTGTTTQTSPTFTYAGTPSAGVGAYECRLTSGDDTPEAFATCPTAGQEYSDLADGAYVFEARAVSHGGNVDPAPVTREFTVDTTAPDTTITAGPDGPTGSADVTFTYGGVPADDTDGFECRLVPDGGTANFAACPEAGRDYTELGDGTYTFEVRAHDAVGNTDATPASRTFTVDTAAPDTTITAGPSGTVGPGDVTFTYEGAPADDTDRFECRLRTADDDDPVFENCPDEGRTYSDLADGTYTFEVRAIDTVDNTDMTPASETFTVDVTAPTVTIATGPAASSTVTTAVFAYDTSPSGDVDAVECRLIRPDDADPAFAACSSSETTYEGLAAGAYRFELRARDGIGNVSAVADWPFTVEAPAVPPVETVPRVETTPPANVSRTPLPKVELPPPAAPQVSGLRLERTVFRALTSGRSFGFARDARVSGERGSWLRFSLDRAAAVELRISRSVKRRWQPVRGVITRRAHAGNNRVPMHGRFRGVTLRPGTYRLSVTVVDRSNGAKTTTLRTFRITR